MTHAYFRQEGELLVPDRTVRSPWNPDHQSGIAVAGQLARAIERAAAAGPMRIARLTVDFLGAVLMRPTAAQVELVRDGPDVQLVEAALWVDSAIAAKATAVRVPAAEAPPPAGPPLPYVSPEAAPREGVTRYFGEGHPLETRVVQRPDADGGPGVFWARFNSAFVAGEPTSAVVRACMIADIASGAAAGPSMRDWRMPNADLSVYFAREPQGDWLLATTQIDVADQGVAATRSTLADAGGVFGYARQMLILSRANADARPRA